LLLDEPTSGLDSSTAARIMKILQNEAEKGVTVVTTIHQPSAEAFSYIDEVIGLHDGYQVFPGMPP